MPVALRRQVEVVADPHGRDQEAELLGQPLAHALDPAHELAVLVLVDQRYQAIADVEADGIGLADVVPGQLAGSLGSSGSGAAAGLASLSFAASAFLAISQAAPAQTAAAMQEREIRHAWHDAEQRQQDGHDAQHARIADAAG